ncbi:hypothetical protein R1flu_001443 [Riccia fluitans]|uniref:BTB domain-containing protein n=1 Tax=Riccia fluitans TaxID=41844 RepID=A0ABD1Y399_9MARC
MELGTHRLLDLELDRKLVLYQEDVLCLKVKAAELRSHILQTAGPSLMKDLRHMGNNPESIPLDAVTFICQDGQRVQASRMLLVAQSEVFRSLLSNGMAETEQSEVALPEVPLDAFLLVLNYLYTAELWEEDLKFSPERVNVPEKDASSQAEHPNHGLDKLAINFEPFSLDWMFMFRAIQAAQFLLLDELECLLITRLSVDLPRHILQYTEEVLNQVIKRFTILCHSLEGVHDGACKKYLYIIGLHLLKIMSEHDLSVTNLRNLSYESMASYMKHTKIWGQDESWTFSFREYIRLWQLIRWCSMISAATESDDSSCDEAASVLWLPDPKRAMSLLMNYAEQMQFFLQLQSHVSELRQEFAAKIHKEHFEELKGTVNLGHIHPELLIHIVEPLQLFSSSQLGEVLRDQLLKASKWRRQLHSHDCRCCWQFLQDGKIRTINDHRLRSDQIAVANAGMWCDLVCQWEIVHFIEYIDKGPVPSSCPSFTFEVGLLSVTGREIMEDSCLSDSECGWAFKLWKEEKLEPVQCMFFENGRRMATVFDGSARMETEETQEQFTAMGPPSIVPNNSGRKWTLHLRVKLDRVRNTCSISHRTSGGKEYSVHVECKNLSRGLLFPAVYVLYDDKCETETQMKLCEGFDLSF